MDKPKQSCQICKKKYGGVFSTQHQCKRCLRSICRQCCTKKKNMFTKTNTKIQEHRCCDLCWPQSQYIANYIKQNALVYNTLSKEGKEWSQLADIDLNQENKLRSRPLKSKIDPVYFHDCWTQMTPSLRQLSGTLITKIPLSNIDTGLKNICEKLSTNSNIDIIIPLIIYIQCHCDQKTTTKIINYLTNISHSINQKQILHNIQILCIKGQTPIDNKTTKNLLSYAKNTVKMLILSYFMNYFTIDIVHHIVVETLLSGDCQMLELVASVLVFQFRGYVVSEKYEERVLRNVVWQGVGLKGLERSVKKLRKLVAKYKTQDKNQQQQLQTKQSRSSATIKLAQISRASQSYSFPKQQQPQQPNTLSSQLSLTNPTQPTHPQTQHQKQKQAHNKELLSKITQAADYLKKLEQNQTSNEVDVSHKYSIEDVEDLDRYLDMVIMENDKELRDYEELERMLEGIQGKLGLQGTSTN